MATPEYFEKKGDVATLKSKLREAMTKKDSKVCHATIKKTIQFMTLGIDVSSICPEIIMASATNDIVQKKLVYLYLCSCAESNSELALLAINTLVKDAVGDDNSMIRGLALRSMLNLRILNLVQYARIPLEAGLTDKSSYVRRNAVMAAVKLYKIDPDMFIEMDLLTTVTNMIQDIDGQVSCNALAAVNEVELSKGGIKLDATLVKYLLSRLPGYNEFSQCVVLEMLTKYNTNEEDEILEYLNDLDERLKHANKAVVMAAVTLFLHFTNNMDWLKNDVYDRIRTPILLMLPSCTAEIIYPILCHISVLIKLKPRLFYKDYKYFFMRNNEPTYVRQKKLEILTEVITEGNLQQIVDEIREYVHDPDISISYKAIYSIGKIALENPFSKDICVNALIDILHLEVDYITAKCLQTLQDVMMRYRSLWSHVLPEINNCWEQVQYHAVGKSAIIWIYGEYGQDIPAAPYHLEEIIENLTGEQCADVKLQLLTAMMKLFFKRAPECKEALGKLLQYCIDEESNTDVRDRALFYYRLLTINIHQAQSLFHSDDDRRVPFPTVPRKQTLSNEDFHLREFNTLSIIYDQPSTSFITQKYYNFDDDSAQEHNIQEHVDSPLPAGPLLESGEKVAVDILLDVSDNATADGLCLVENFAMEKSEFQSAWKTMPHSLQFEEKFTVLPEHDELLSVMQSKRISLMACSKPEQPNFWKFFFYASMAENGGSVVLVEMIVYYQENRMTVVTKSTDEEILNVFNEFYRNLFIGKWIALPYR